jgi:uncharacterized protein involved in exopolysaccharide biosynthesis
MDQTTDTIDIAHVARTIGRGWRAIVAFTVLGIVAAVAVDLFAPRQYTARATVILKPGAGGTSVAEAAGIGGLAGGLLGNKSSMETELQIMSSRAVVGQIVDSLRLQAIVQAPKPIASAGVLRRVDAPGSFKPVAYDFVLGSDGAYAVSGGQQQLRMRPGSPLVTAGGTFVFSTTHPLPREFHVDLLDREEAIDRVQKRLVVDVQKGEVAAITYVGGDSVTAALVPNLLLDVYFDRRRGTDRGVNQRRVEFLTAKNDSMERELGQAATRLRQQQESAGVLDPTAVAKVELETGAALRARLLDVRVEQGALQQLMSQVTNKTATPRQLAAYPTFLKSPAVNALVSNLSDIETKRLLALETRTPADREVVALEQSAANIEKQLVPYATTYGSSLEKQRKDIEASLDSLNERMARLPSTAESAGRLQRDVADLAKMSGLVQANLVEAKLAAISEGGDVRTLDTAMPPRKRSFPNPILLLGLGTVGGFFAGVIGALLIGTIGRWMRDPVDVERFTGIPAVAFDPAVPLLVANQSTRTLVVAPTQPGVTVTPVVNRLARTAASRSLSTGIFTVNGDTRDVERSIASLEAEHDFVIVELSSLVSDAAAGILRSSRPVLLVTAGRRAERRELARAVQMLKRLDVPVVGIVLNGADVKAALTAP